MKIWKHSSFPMKIEKIEVLLLIYKENAEFPMNIEKIEVFLFKTQRKLRIS